MPLEAVMICLDNSQWMRNGDFTPTRLEAQTEAINYIAEKKIQSNQESTVGVLSMSGPRIEVHASPSRDIGTIMNSLGKNLRPYGKCNFIAGMKTAQLALKKRLNKKQQQRIIVFVGSPVENEIKELEKLGKQLKKNSVAVDIINFGTENVTNDNRQKLEAFRNAVNTSADNSHLVNVPTGPNIVLLGYLLNTPIMLDSNSSVPNSGGTTSNVSGWSGSQQDTEMDMVIRMSLEAERRRLMEEQEEKKKASAAKSASEKKEPASGEASATVQDNQSSNKNNDDGDDDDDDDDDEDSDDDEGDDAEALANAIAMSLAGGQSNEEKKDDGKEEKATETTENAEGDEGDREGILCDRDFLADIMKDIEMDEDEVDDILEKLNETDDDDD